MSLINLIKDQVVKIDDHKWGCREIKSFEGDNLDVHLDKRTNFPINGKLQHVIVKISLNSDREPQILIKNKKAGEIPKSLSKEIKNTLNNEKLLKAFFLDIATVIKDYESKLNDVDKCIQVFDRVAKHFGLEKTGKEIFNMDKSFEAIYQEADTKRKFNIQMTKDDLKIGEKNGEGINYFKK